MKDFGKCESTDMIKIGTKELRYPIVQGGMGIGISLGNLAGAVAKAGGAGTISAAVSYTHLLFQECDILCIRSIPV